MHGGGRWRRRRVGASGSDSSSTLTTLLSGAKLALERALLVKLEPNIALKYMYRGRNWVEGVGCQFVVGGLEGWKVHGFVGSLMGVRANRRVDGPW